MPFRVLVLAAGKGTRFKSNVPKVLHEILGKPMLWYVLRAVEEAGAEEVFAVVGHGREGVERFLREEFPEVKVVHQEEQLGTGHAVMCAEPVFRGCRGKVVVLNGDMPLVEPEDVRRVSEADGDMVVLTGFPEDPSSYGRVVRDGNEVLRIVEESDADEEERRIGEVNAGIYAFDCEKLFSALGELESSNAQGEYYLTDVLKVFRDRGWKVTPVSVRDFSSVMGVNNRYELSVAERELLRRLVKRLQLSGVSVHNPDALYVEPDVEVGEDTRIFAPAFLKGKTQIGKGCYIGPFTEIEDSQIGDFVRVESHCWIRGAVLKEGASVGPFAKLRPGTVVGEGAKVGTFVETKNARLEKGAKANHLSYLGDCRVGEDTNIGAGTITCNYDGFNKWFTDIGKNVFVGSNTLFIAPVKVGDNSITAAGSVITSDVPEGALAVGRARQVNLEGKAEVIRERARRRKGDGSR